MSVETIISRIREEAEKEIQAIRAEETCEVDAIRAQYEQKAENAYNHRLAEGLREIRQMIASMESRSRIEAKRKVREVREEMLSRCFQDVSAYLKNIRSTPEYPAFLSTMILDSARNLGPSEIAVRVHPDDRPLAAEIISTINKEGYSLSLSDEPVDTGGGAVCERIADGVFIDNTVEVRFVRLEREMIVNASKILFSGDM
ncbi:MAG TPA: V-type ATP synthase subunit E [Methanospirillum sp.]|uniref:V-type ATP synthase subunit E n=1 Tax=Methanospirillum sp. TaxID=45200 RepID=UPI002C16ECDE|nr:V-type ATP synthase subunit E [Methanospirillum sp.]HOJ97485.1 V-type ATP synthase subunit E [Methanospirillum sp.]HOL41451.1 V-type ATP synthase subunit E [Methanospirillum sp.]